MPKRYIEFFATEPPYIGEIEIEEGDDPLDYLPKGCYGFRIYERSIYMDGDKEILGRPEIISETVYIGHVVDIKKAKEESIENREWLEHLEKIGYKKVLRTNLGKYRPFQEDSKIIQK